MSVVKPAAMAFADLRRRLDQSLVYDWAMRCPIVVFSSLILLRDVPAFCQQVVQEPALFGQLSAGTLIATAARISQWMFMVLLSIQQLVRLRPLAKSDRLLPRAGALIAVCVPLMFPLLERAAPNPVFDVAAVTISLLASTMSVVTVSFLGRSLSVMPEARQLKHSGPYALVRHPLYLCEMIGTGAVALQYRSLPAAGLLMAAVALQVARGRWEEVVLARAFPDFAAYRAQTSFIIPRDPLHFFASFLEDHATRRRCGLVGASMAALVVLVAAALPRLLV